MSEEKEEVKVNTEEAAQGTADSLAQVEALVGMMPELAEDKELSGLSEIVKNASTDNSEPKEEKEEVEEEPAEEKEEVEEEEEKEEKEEVEEEPAEEKEEVEEEEEDPDDIFGFSSGKKKSVEVDFEFGDETKSYIKTKYSIEDESKFITSVDKWRGDSQELTKTQDQLEELSDGIRSLPDNLKAAVNAYANGQDYHQAFGISNRIDYNKSYKDQNKNGIVEHYFADKFKAIVEEEDSDDITQEEADKRIEDLYDVAEGLYKRDKTGIENKRADMIREQQESMKKVKESVNSSVTSLKKDFPNFKSGDIQRIKQILVDGNLESQFLNKDGSYKESAALMLAFALHNDSIMKRVEGIAKGKGTTEANMKIAQRGKTKVSTQKAAAAKQSRKAHAAIAHLGEQIDNSDPYE